MVRIVVLIAISMVLARCNQANFNVQVDREGATVNVQISEAEANTLLSSLIASGPNPLLRNPSIDLQNGQIVVNGEHDRRDGGGRVRGSLTLTPSVNNGALQLVVTSANIEGVDLNDGQISQLNQRIAEGLNQRAIRDNQFARLERVSVTSDALTFTLRVSR